MRGIAALMLKLASTLDLGCRGCDPEQVCKNGDLLVYRAADAPGSGSRSEAVLDRPRTGLEDRDDEESRRWPSFCFAMTGICAAAQRGLRPSTGAASGSTAPVLSNGRRPAGRHRRLAARFGRNRRDHRHDKGRGARGGHPCPRSRRGSAGAGRRRHARNRLGAPSSVDANAHLPASVSRWCRGR